MFNLWQINMQKHIKANKTLSQAIAIVFISIAAYSGFVSWQKINVTALNSQADSLYNTMPEKSAALYNKIANVDQTGHAQLMLGNLYLSGRGVEQDNIQAINWYKKAKEKFHDTQLISDILLRLGFAYTYSNDALNAFKCINKAAKLGNPDAQFVLAGLYEKGTGTPIDHENAYAWITTALAQKNTTLTNNATDKKIEQLELDLKKRMFAAIYVFNGGFTGIREADKLAKKYYKSYVLHEESDI